MTGFETPRIAPLGATALLARFGGRIDRDLSLRIALLVDRLDQLNIAGVVDFVPAYTTLIVLFDHQATDAEAVGSHIRSAWYEIVDSQQSDYPREHVIDVPVVYGGEAGPDLDEVAATTGLSPDEVIRRHAEADYTVGALGFSPGFAFLIGLPPELETPRRSTPRTRVPAGSVGIGGAQTGIYSLPTPGGWSLIGRTPRTLFDPRMASSDELRPGDQVRFVPVSIENVTFAEPSLAGDPNDASVNGAIGIVEPGVQTSVQDLGRPGQGRSGITPGGAADRSALVAGNRLLGNLDDAAALEWTLLPPAIRFHEPCRIVPTGADPGWRCNGDAVAIGQILAVSAGDELRGDPSRQPLGARGYVCVAGGIDVQIVRGSRSLDLSAGFGGGFGRPLKRADLLPVGEGEDNPRSDNTISTNSAADPSSVPFRVVRGPQADRFNDAAWSTFLHESFTVDPQSNRMGLRLNGPAIMPSGGADVISEGVVTGSIQVTGGGQPIVLLPGRATIGGYTKIATVIEADHDRLAQQRPGATIRFAEVSIDDARDALRCATPSVRGGLATTSDEESSMTETDDTRDKPAACSAAGDDWTPGGVIAVIRELASQNVQGFFLRIESAGLEIAIDRGGGLPGRPGRPYERSDPSTKANATDTEDLDNEAQVKTGVVIAPLLGIFYRRTSPDAPMLVEEGDMVEEEQTVGLIEVMKSYHEVTAPLAGRVTQVLIEDGESVEYGTVLMRLEPMQEG